MASSVTRAVIPAAFVVNRASTAPPSAASSGAATDETRVVAATVNALYFAVYQGLSGRSYPQTGYAPLSARAAPLTRPSLSSR